jgi:hypothetical protein
MEKFYFDSCNNHDISGSSIRILPTINDGKVIIRKMIFKETNITIANLLLNGQYNGKMA